MVMSQIVMKWVILFTPLLLAKHRVLMNSAGDPPNDSIMTHLKKKCAVLFNCIPTGYFFKAKKF